MTYTYGSSKPHAVTSLTNGNLYKYDAVGNMTHRGYLNGQTRITDTLTYDNENRLTDITFGNANPSAEYYYDGSGKRIIAKVGTSVTMYVGGIMEYSPAAGGQFTKYYYIGSQRLAMKTSSGTLHFFANDHLGSTSLTLNSDSTVLSELRYKPFGETRWSSTTATPTQRRYTGQIQDFATSSMQLYFYNARYYDPALGRFTQADTIVPEPVNLQSLNRFSYVLNNPLKYIDPSGYCGVDADGNITEMDAECTLDQFNAMSWASRIAWLKWFSGIAGNYFDNVIGIIEYFQDDSTFNNSDWAKYSDAGVLLAIQDGWRIKQGQKAIGNYDDFTSNNPGQENPAEAWAAFFRSVGPEGENLTLWGKAEQAGVDYGLYIAQPFFASAGQFEQAKITVFVAWGNQYRSLVSANNIWPGITHPSNSGSFVYWFSTGIIDSDTLKLSVGESCGVYYVLCNLSMFPW